MDTYFISSERDPGSRADPIQRSSVQVLSRWTHHAYKMAHDGSSTIVYLEDGIRVLRGDTETDVKLDLRGHKPREFIFHPDSKTVAFWAPLDKKISSKQVAVLNTASPDSHSIFYTPEKGHVPLGMEWSPPGDCLFVLERVKQSGLSYSLINRIEYPGGSTSEIVRVLGKIDFFMPPVSRFESGGGKSNAPYQIIFGAEDGLYLMDPKGRNKRRISKLPATGLHNIEWNPQDDRQQVLLFFRFPAAASDGRMLRGVYLVHIDQIGENPDEDDEFLEPLYEGTDVHTLWYSPKGTYATWSNRTTVWYRKPEDPPEAVTALELLDHEDEPLQIRGTSWSHSEKKICIAGEGRVDVYDLEEQDPEKRQYTVYQAEEGFVAEPVWVGDQIFMTVVADISEELKEKRKKPVMTRPEVIPMGN